MGVASGVAMVTRCIGKWSVETASLRGKTFVFSVCKRVCTHCLSCLWVCDSPLLSATEVFHALWPGALPH